MLLMILKQQMPLHTCYLMVHSGLQCANVVIRALCFQGGSALMLADRLEVKCGQGPLREVPGESWWPHKLRSNRALLAPLRNTASHCARLKKRISRSAKGFPSQTPGQRAKLCLIIQSLSETVQSSAAQACRSFPEPSPFLAFFVSSIR